MSRLSREKRDQQGTAQPAVLAAAPIDVLVGPAGAAVGGVPVTPVPGEELHQTVLNHLHRVALATGHPVHTTVHDHRIGYVLALRIDTDGSSRFTAEPTPTAPPGAPGATFGPEGSGRVSYAGESGEAFGPGDSGRVSYAGESGQVSTSREQRPLSEAGEPRGLRLGKPGGAPYPREQGQAPYSPEPGEASRQTPPPAPPTAFTPGPAESAQPASPSVPADSVLGAAESALPSGSFARGVAESPGASAWPTPPSEPADFVPGAAESPRASAESAQPASPSVPAGPDSSAEPADQPPRDKPTHLFRQTPEPPTFPLRALPDPEGQEPRDAVPTFRLRAVPEWVAEAAPGTVAPPTGQFGPPPVMDAPVTDVPPADAPPTDAKPETVPRPTPTTHPEPSSGPAPTSGLAPAPGPSPTSGLTPAPARKPILGFTASAPVDEPDPKPTPPRGFDAVAEAVLGDDPATAYDGGGTVFLAGPMARINEAVKAGRVTEASQLAEQTVGEASRTLGTDHPEVLRLLELTAYIAYLAGEPARAFDLSLDLARTRHHARDTEAAYGNIQSAATAWRAVRDPEQGLRMGADLIGLWTELTMEGGAAAEDIDQLESARTRMGRLTERARKLNS
ncbi:tetratricopeptide repeat protein [Streptomyces sp. NPDC051001]|uniref:tetratricopeptide repeat protein n=1 Tax=Streptomyces sp. NPDC051001 TaxID=3155795 RepID=UPI0034201581